MIRAKLNKYIAEAMFIIAFLIIFITTLFLNVYVAFYQLALFFILEGISILKNHERGD